MARVLLALLALGVSSLASAGWMADPPAPETGVIVLEDPLTPPDATSPPVCGATDTYSMVQVAPGLNELFTWNQGTRMPCGYFVESDAETLVFNQAVEIYGYVGVADWILAVGYAGVDGGELVETGMLISVMRLVDGEGNLIEFSTATTVPVAFAQTNIAATRSAISVGVVPEGGEGANAGVGSSCSCDVCPLGGRFWVPFVVVGAGASTPEAGQACCRTACNIACERLHSGMEIPEAWIIGQGTWVLCMICE